MHNRLVLTFFYQFLSCRILRKTGERGPCRSSKASCVLIVRRRRRCVFVVCVCVIFVCDLCVCVFLVYFFLALEKPFQLDSPHNLFINHPPHTPLGCCCYDNYISL
jgi:hypothetical protein